jgi:hypothetical protein
MKPLPNSKPMGNFITLAHGLKIKLYYLVGIFVKFAFTNHLSCEKLFEQASMNFQLS